MTVSNKRQKRLHSAAILVLQHMQLKKTQNKKITLKLSSEKILTVNLLTL